MPTSHLDIPPEVKAAVDRGDKISAIKLLRDATGLGLKEAKDAVEHIEAGGSFDIPSRVVRTTDSKEIARVLQQGKKLEAIRLYREQKGVGLKEAKEAIEAMLESHRGFTAGASPGEAKRSGGLTWVALAVVAGAVAAYLYFGQG